MCGIWSIINQGPEQFDYQSFCTLGIANDRRGGDSCGIFIDGKVEYGITTKAKFEDFFWSSELLNTIETATIALGHDRKASVGGVSLDKAHPIIIKEKVEGTDEEVIKFVLVHNGTIHNYEDLAKKYIPDVDIKNMSDSQVIARLLYYAGFDWLAEYNGGAAFIAVDYRGEEPEVLLWRGESKKYSTDKEMEEERPLYCNLENNRLVVSSIPSYLHVVDGNCYMVPANKVLIYKEGKLFIVQEIDRSKAQQNKTYDWVKYNGNNSYSHGSNNTTNTVRYLVVNEYDNTYKIGTILADGYLRISTYGRILTKYDTSPTGEPPHQIYFFNGIALIDRKAYVFLCKAWKRTKLTLDEFTLMYQNMIRYFSIDQLYFNTSILYKAIDPFDREKYTGFYQMLGETSSNYYDGGLKTTRTKIGVAKDAFAPLENVPKFDYKTIWKRFIQSIA